MKPTYASMVGRLVAEKPSPFFTSLYQDSYTRYQALAELFSVSRILKSRIRAVYGMRPQRFTHGWVRKAMSELANGDSRPEPK